MAALAPNPSASSTVVGELGDPKTGGGTTVTSHLLGLWRFLFGGGRKIEAVSLGGYWGCSCRGGVKFKTAGGRFGSQKTSESAGVFMFLYMSERRQDMFTFGYFL